MMLKAKSESRTTDSMIQGGNICSVHMPAKCFLTSYCQGGTVWCKPTSLLSAYVYVLNHFTDMHSHIYLCLLSLQPNSLQNMNKTAHIP